MHDELSSFVERIQAEGKRLYRELPWRNIDDPYQVLVSEIMLQQTQVKRVLGYWDSFLALFPTLDALAAAETSLVLEQWQGLGYNRRALSLQRAAQQCSREYRGNMPQTYEELLALPGVGPATAAGVCAFAYNRPSVYIETNVRAVFIHEFFPQVQEVKDSQIYPLVEATCPQTNPRAWYYALLDYGAHLKQHTVNPSRKSAHYSKQSAFEGSRRQKRAEILRCVLGDPGIEENLLFEHLQAFEAKAGRRTPHREEFDSIIDDLVQEKFFNKEIHNGTIFFKA